MRLGKRQKTVGVARDSTRDSKPPAIVTLRFIHMYRNLRFRGANTILVRFRLEYKLTDSSRQFTPRCPLEIEESIFPRAAVYRGRY